MEIKEEAHHLGREAIPVQVTIDELLHILHSEYSLGHITEKFLRLRAGEEILVQADYREARRFYHREASVIRLLSATNAKITGVTWAMLSRILSSDHFSADSIHNRLRDRQTVSNIIAEFTVEIKASIASDREKKRQVRLRKKRK